MSDLNQLISNNRSWAKNIKEQNPTFFCDLSEQQNPEFLWIGCSDSRVPANQIAGLPPGEVFVHRNIANVVVHTDLNCLSVIQYAVDVLKVKHIIVTGHYGCGGVLASMENEQFGLIDNWLRHLKDVYRYHEAELDAIEDKKQRADRLCELNVVEQVKNVSQTSIVQNAWSKGQDLSVHGCIYSIQNGILNNLDISISGNS
ncbi:carbonate dehydratase [Agarivorans sp. B2Z047]|jgi:carbonic anhydrase|uniref:Carbonic anhydrase n=1 Tax=Agarivorans albus MKT 106 TaxID=1331007 RepID=R9PMP6_AGAAL|nr:MULTISPECIES: carbonate dehydratase [Agarivorans]MPW27778.1 carbonate dehydratase [Agarivorans sp. B2Z047]UQN44386.1 carbonate dehydratase [Agarivorans sp. B2Z047]GAD02634.1 carbonic anhydrase [Agarivorans albus MKT 106]